MAEFEVFEKATGKLLGSVAGATGASVASAVDQARTAGRNWARLPATERVATVAQLRILLLGAANEFAELLSRENGKPRHESLLHEVIPLLDAMDWLVRTVPPLTQGETLTPRWLKHRTHHVRSRPRGVLAILAPFNFPLLISGVDALSALCMGCTVLLKPSEHCPLVVQRFAELAHQAGIPSAALQVLHGGPEVGGCLLDAEVDAVLFTGSTEHGRSIAVHCAERLRPCTLELGGNSPLVVLPDADLERAARAIVYGALANSGQSCFAVGRVLVPRAQETKLAERVYSLVADLRQGDPMTGHVELGALSTRAQIERCRDHVLEAITRGAQRLGPAAELNPPHHFFPPTVLRGCTDSTRVYREETFGPVIALCPYDDEHKVQAALNREPSGLAAYVFGGAPSRSTEYAEGLDYGHVLVDQVLLSYVCPEVPLSGLRMSGLGVVHGREGLRAHSTPQILGTPKLRLPSSMEFALLDPIYAESVARSYLSSTQTLGTLARWLSG